MIMSGCYSFCGDVFETNEKFGVLRLLRLNAVKHRKHRVSIYIERGVLRCRVPACFVG